MSAFHRPPTPFPEEAHIYQTSYFHPHPMSMTHTPQPLHFHMTKMADKVPPSLLSRGRGSINRAEKQQQSASSSSPPSSSSSMLPKPLPLRRPHNSPRDLPTSRASSFSSTISPPFPTTPLSSPSYHDALSPPTPLALPSPLIYDSAREESGVNFLNGWTEGVLAGLEALEAGKDDDGRGRKRSRGTEKPGPRRGTPAPFSFEGLASLADSSGLIADRGERYWDKLEVGRSLKSAVDGGKWVVVG